MAYTSVFLALSVLMPVAGGDRVFLFDLDDAAPPFLVLLFFVAFLTESRLDVEEPVLSELDVELDEMRLALEEERDEAEDEESSWES